jgi:DNA anti-recombination protein RmuC
MFSVVQALIPAGLTARKVFWSAVNPDQLTSYTVTTRLMAPRRTQSPPAHHLVVEHGTSSSQRQQEDEMVAEFLANMKKVSSIRYTVTTRLMAPRRTQSPPAHHLVVEHGTSSSQRQQEDEMVAEFLANMKKVSSIRYTVTTRLMAPRPTQSLPAHHLVVEHGTSSSQRQQEDEMVAEFLANMKKVSSIRYTVTTRLMAPRRTQSPPAHHLVVEHGTNSSSRRQQEDETVAEFLANMKKVSSIRNSIELMKLCACFVQLHTVYISTNTVYGRFRDRKKIRHFCAKIVFFFQK